MLQSQGRGTERVEENRHLEQVAEVVRGLNILKLRGHLYGGTCGLGVNTLLAHFRHAVQ